MISTIKKLFPNITHDAPFFYAMQIAVEKMGNDDEDYLMKFSSLSMIFQKLEKRTPLEVRFFDQVQWDFYKNNLLNGIFFILKNKKFYKEVG